MTFSNLLAQISIGGVMAITGSVIVGAGLAVGLHTAIPEVPLWLCLTLIGTAVGGVGIGLIGTGTEKTEDKVEKNLSVGYQISQNPITTAAIAAVGGLVLYRLLFPGGSSSSEDRSSDDKAAKEKKGDESKKQESTSIFSSMGDSLAKIGSMAGAAALGLGLRSVGLPSLNQVEDLFMEAVGLKSNEASKKDSSRKEESQKAKSDSRTHNGYQQQQA